MITIEIFRRDTGEVVDTTQADTLKQFLIYWCSQCNTEEYGWREVTQQEKSPSRAG